MNVLEIAAIVGALALVILALAAWRIGSQMRITNMIRAAAFKSATIDGVEVVPKLKWAQAHLEEANHKIGVRP